MRSIHFCNPNHFVHVLGEGARSRGRRLEQGSTPENPQLLAMTNSFHISANKSNMRIRPTVSVVKGAHLLTLVELQSR